LRALIGQQAAKGVPHYLCRIGAANPLVYGDQALSAGFVWRAGF